MVEVRTVVVAGNTGDRSWVSVVNEKYSLVYDVAGSVVGS